MIAGVTGRLLSSGYLAGLQAADEAAAAGFDAWARSVVAWWRRAEQALGPASPPRMVLDVGARPLLESLGYGVGRVEPQPWGHAAVVSASGQPVAALLNTVWGTPAAHAWRHALGGSIAAQLPWALIFSGDSLVVVDATRPWTRRLLAFDLRVVCRDRAAMHAMWTLARASSLRPSSDSSTAAPLAGEPGAGSLTAPRSPLARAVAASDAHGVSVCSALGAGVLEALGELLSALDASEGRPRRGHRHGRDTSVVFEQSLTIVYRLLFLLFAEARDLVPTWHRVYREAYSVDALCRRLMTHPQSRGVWAAVQAMSRLAHAGCRTHDLQVTAFNGRLFAPARTPLAEQSRVPDAAAARAVLSLGTTGTADGRRSIAFDDLGVEQLGAVYERVLEYEPVRQDQRLTLRRTSTERKTTGSFYTPRAVTDFLVRRTLAPLVQGRSAAQIMSLRIVDPAMGSGAFLVAACRYLTDRAEQAHLADGTWTPGDVTEASRAELSRSIAERCLYGIDRQPTAVQLARLSLWLTTLAADRPLTFLDHHLAVGNSLVGARLADLSRAPAPRAAAQTDPTRTQLELFDGDAVERMGRLVVPERLRLSLDPSSTPAAVREKERRLERLLSDSGALAAWRRAADLWCGLALDGSRGVGIGLYSDLQQHIAGQPTSLTSQQCAAIIEPVLARAREHGACHWELLFPEVFLREDGQVRDEPGFDAVLGNPPWEMLRGDTGNSERRADARGGSQALMHFVRQSGQYPLQGRGHVNQYQLFVERALSALRPGGRIGIILPSGIQTDVGSANLRHALIDGCAIDTWLGFENRHAIFPIHRGVRFVLLAGTRGAPAETLSMAAGLTDPEWLHQLPDDPRGTATGVGVVSLTRTMLHRWDPAHLTIPAFGTPLDASIGWRVMQAPALAASDGWHVRFGRELNATDDGTHFVETVAPVRLREGGDWLPVVDGRHLRPFSVNFAAVQRVISRRVASRLLDASSTFDRPRIGYRDVASASNRLTMIAAPLPAGAVSTHTVFCSRALLGMPDLWCLLGLLNSLVVNYVVRLQMTTHVTTALMARLPVPRPAAGTAMHQTLASLAERLSRDAIEGAPDAYARVNALAAQAFGLTGTEYAQVVSTFPLLPAALRQRCLDAFDS